MKRNLTYFFALFFLCRITEAQTSEPARLSFQDSIRVVLENTKAIDASAIGASFGGSWINFSPDQQLMIRRQGKLMKKKGYRLQPHFVNYYGAIMAAVNVEKLDATKLSQFLNVVDKSVEKNNVNQVNIFLHQARDFFEHHALNYEKYFRLKAADDDYTFDYLEPAAPDTTQVPYDPKADSIAAALPSWQKPVPQPQLLGPVIVFKSVSLNFITPFDSAFLKNTKGTFSLGDRIFVGEGGQFDWSPAGLSADSVYYEFNKYNFKTTQASLGALQGKLTYVGKLPGKVAGTFDFKSVKHQSKKFSIYPRFKSYENNVTISGLGSDKLKYSGGFGLEGAQMTSNSVSGKPATLEVLGESDKKFKATSLTFTFKDSLMVANSVRMVIYQGVDSITHPSMQMRYAYGKKELLTLSKDNTPLRKSPFSSSYFGIDFHADLIRWDLKSDSLDIFIQGSGRVSPMIIESKDFYDPEDFRQLKDHAFDFNPLVRFVNHAAQVGTQDFSVFELTDSKNSIGTLRMAADFLSQKGMIDYDARSGKIHVKDKAMHFLESAKGKVDYDNMKIHSLADTIANATLNFKKNVLTVRGVEEFKISDSLKVLVKPDSSIITVLHNRGLQFKGTIDAGNFEITGKEFTFSYDSFLVDLRHIDSIRFYVTEKNGTRRRVNNSMVGTDSTAVAAAGLEASSNKTSGTLYINRPDNKSGRVKYAHFPRLDASAGGAIYFDRQDVLAGAYDRSVFFIVPPFKLDSLNDADPASINFDGTFVSGGMFPNFKEKLHTMPDKSLGFTHAVPSEG
ncbi:MAG: hypothetical protein HY015_08825, partial [Bacteroidetes bacterium]|nr:hypothetical protein [Bacteroidota bacterium]